MYSYTTSGVVAASASGVGKSPVEGGSYHIHPLVCALGGKNYRNQQFVRVVIMQLGLRYGAVFPEPGEYLFITFFLSHRNLFL